VIELINELKGKVQADLKAEVRFASEGELKFSFCGLCL
jgi:hypothetical protein